MLPLIKVDGNHDADFYRAFECVPHDVVMRQQALINNMSYEEMYRMLCATQAKSFGSHVEFLWKQHASQAESHVKEAESRVKEAESFASPAQPCADQTE